MPTRSTASITKCLILECLSTDKLCRIIVQSSPVLQGELPQEHTAIPATTGMLLQAQYFSI